MKQPNQIIEDMPQTYIVACYLLNWEFAYNSSMHTSTERSPPTLMYDFHP